jgi:hypothetical protein
VPFELAGLDIDTFRRVEPRYQRFMQLDQRAAWVGQVEGRPGGEVRIEAGAHEGRVSLWCMLESDELEELAAEPGNLRGTSFNHALFVFLLTAGLIGGVIVARHNLRVGRADRAGTARLAVFLFALTMLGEMLRAHRLFSMDGWTEIYPITATALFYAVISAALYLAVEPHARRIWPSMLVSWSRVLGRSAGWRDARIGASVLWGALAAAGIALLSPLRVAAVSAAQGAPATPTAGDWTILLGARHALSRIVIQLGASLPTAFFLVLLLVLGRVTLRRAWPAVVAATLVWIAMADVIQNTPAETVIVLVLNLISTAVMLALVLRRGVLALIVCMFAGEVAIMAQASDWQAWDGRPALLALAVFAAMVAYGYWASTPRKVVKAGVGANAS